MSKYYGWWFVFLPVYPPIFAIGAVILGVYSWQRRFLQPLWIISFVVFAIFGTVSQVFSPTTLDPSPAWLGLDSEVRRTNLVRFNSLAEIRAWNPEEAEVNWAIKQKDGFWRIDLLDSQTHKPLRAILGGRQYPVETGKSYTQSVYFRSDSKNIAFDFYFTTARGQTPVAAHFEQITQTVRRAYATYAVVEGDKWIRPLDFSGFSGDWNYIEFAYPQLELGTIPTPYNQVIPIQAKLSRVIWWIGTCLLGVLALSGCIFLISKAELSSIGWAILLGMAIQIVVSILQIKTGNFFIDSRVSGLAVQPNFLGHQSVPQAALVWLLGNSLAGFYAIVSASLLVGFSQSRAAFIGISMVWLGWWQTLPRRWQWITLSLAIVGLVAGFVVKLPLGRFVDIFNDPSRLQIWHLAWLAFIQHPLTGLGLGGYEVFYFQQLTPLIFDRLASHAHNLFLQLLAETGILGLAGSLQLLIVIGATFIRAKQWGILTGLICVLGMNLLDFTFFYAGVYYSFWAIAALGLAQSLEKGKMPQ